MKHSEAEILLAKHLEELGLFFVQEYRFHGERKWRWDFLLTEHRIAIEIDGYFKGRHGTGWGSDNEKRNNGTMLGYRVLVFSTSDVLKGRAKEFLQANLKWEDK